MLQRRATYPQFVVITCSSTLLHPESAVPLSIEHKRLRKWSAGAFYIDEGARVNITNTVLCGNVAVIGGSAIIGERSEVVYNPQCCPSDGLTCFEVRTRAHDWH